MSVKKEHHKFFTLILEEYNEDGLLEATKVPAKKGKSLFDLVEPIFENYGISFDTHSLFLGSSNTPLPLHEDTYPYRGYTLYARENEKFRIMSSFRRNDSKKSAAAGASKRFSQLLDEYENVGFENADRTDGLKEIDENDEYMLENSWKDVIDEELCPTNRQKVQQEAIWELFTTEVRYIKDLEVVIEVFKRCFKMLHYAGYLTEVNDKLIFANIDDVYNSNIQFWRRLRTIIEDARDTKEPISAGRILDSFVGFEECFLPYIEYCSTDMSTIKLPDFPTSVNVMIKQFITWCDNHARCKRITLAGFLIKPVQRMTRYTLLLKAIRKKTEDDNEKQRIEEVETNIKTFISKMNSTVHMRKEQEKLDNAVLRLSEYSPIEPMNDEVEKIIKDYCTLNLTDGIPGLSGGGTRFLLKEGPIKLVGKQGKRDSYAFLFSDVLLVTKLKKSSHAEKYRVNHQPYLLTKIRIHTLKENGHFLLVYLNEYDVITTAFIFTENIDDGDTWKASIEHAQEHFERIKKELSASEESLADAKEFLTSSTESGFTDDNKQMTSFRNRAASIRRSTLIEQIVQPENKPDIEYEKEPNIEGIECDFESIEPETSIPVVPIKPVLPAKIEISFEWDNALSMALFLILIGFNLMTTRLVSGLADWL